jgi:hypothetical protein
LRTGHEVVQLVQGHLDVKGVLRGIECCWGLTSNGLLLDVLGFGLGGRDDAFHAFRHDDRACGAGREEVTG